MNRYLILAIGLLCGLMILLAVSRTSSDAPANGLDVRDPASRKPAATASVTSEPVPLQRVDEKTAARVQELEKMEANKRQRDLAAEKTRQSRADIQRFRHRAWMEVIQTYQPEFETLRAAAAQSPEKKVPCAICGAKGILDLCVVCDHTGKCPSCKGTGKVVGGVCPTCVGSGKCFLCRGSGKMDCPFCQSSPLTKEVITPTTPDPPRDFPLDEVASSPPPPYGSRPSTQ